MTARTLISDLGGVIVHFSFDRAFAAWSRASGVDAALIASRFRFADEAYCRFETGSVTVADYADHLRRCLGLSLTDEELVDGYRAIFLGVDPDVHALYRELAGAGVRLVVLTNTNVAHRVVWSERYASELAVFDAIYASCDLGARKPEAEAFTQVLAAERLAARDVVFLDDTPACVDGARRCGIEAYRFTGAGQARHDLRRAGFPV
jgi:FMN phosphatase YigB (HAD superfamily)